MKPASSVLSPSACVTSAGVPSASSEPLCSTSTRSAPSASSTQCVAHSTHTPRSRTSARKAASRSWRDFGSSPTVASSISSTAGWCRLARTSSTLRRLPPESSRTLRFRSASTPSRAQSAWMRWCASARGSPCRSAWNSRLRRMLRSMSSEICWNTTPMWRSARVGAWRSEWPATSTSPSSAANRPVSTWNSVDLPAPLGPSSATNWPAGTDSESDFNAGRSP